MAALAAAGERGRYPYDVSRSGAPRQIDLRPMVRNAVYELIGGEAPAVIAARFHNTVAVASAHVIRLAASQHGRRQVVLTGGCFQNAHLAELLLAELAPAFQVALHRQVPPGDGGIALGQAVAANASEGDVCA
jgi:hydrogenase maturation protein HypF